MSAQAAAPAPEVVVTYVVTASSVMVTRLRNQGGLILRGDVVPDDIDPAQLQHLLDLGMVEPVDPSGSRMVPFGGDRSSLGPNPLVARAGVSRRGVQVAAAAGMPVPSLFAGSDLPAFTASGVDPSTLSSVPWNSRHALASAESTAEAYAIVDALSGLSPEQAEAAAVEAGYADHPGVARYEAAVAAWARAAGVTDAPAASAPASAKA